MPPSNPSTAGMPHASGKLGERTSLFFVATMASYTASGGSCGSSWLCNSARAPGSKRGEDTVKKGEGGSTDGTAARESDGEEDEGRWASSCVIAGRMEE